MSNLQQQQQTKHDAGPERRGRERSWDECHG
jgi:hypothetical protein